MGHEIVVSRVTWSTEPKEKSEYDVTLDFLEQTPPVVVSVEERMCASNASTRHKSSSN